MPPSIASLISALEGEAAALCAAINRPNLTPISLAVHPADAPSWALVQRLVAQSDAVLSLLPATMHVPLAELCIDVGTPMVTASYVSDAMQALHTRATQANVPILCAMGLDLRMDRCMLVLITAPIPPLLLPTGARWDWILGWITCPLWN